MLLNRPPNDTRDQRTSVDACYVVEVFTDRLCMDLCVPLHLDTMVIIGKAFVNLLN